MAADGSPDLFTGFTFLGSGWTDNLDGTLSCDGTQAGDSDILQANFTTSGVSYYLTYEITDYVAGTLTPAVGAVDGAIRSSNGTFTDLMAAVVTNGAFSIEANSTFVGTVRVKWRQVLRSCIHNPRRQYKRNISR